MSLLDVIRRELFGKVGDLPFERRSINRVFPAPVGLAHVFQASETRENSWSPFLPVPGGAEG